MKTGLSVWNINKNRIRKLLEFYFWSHSNFVQIKTETQHAILGVAN